MATDKKKTLQEQASEAGQTYSDELLNNAAMADAYQSQLNVEKANYLNNVAQAQEAANAEAIETAQQAQEANYKNGLDQILEMGNRVKQAEQEAEQTQKANYQAAKWTGATQAVASLANLFAVGQGNAVSQQYRDYSQDWMRRADINAREQRARIENLRERQRAMQDRLNVLKSGDVNALADMRMKANEARAKAQAEAGKTMFDALSKGAESSVKARNDAAKAQYEADLAGLKMTASGRRASSGGTARSGSSKTASTKTTKATDPRKVSGEPYHITTGGKEYVAKMSKQARKQAFIDGSDELKEDILKMAGASSWQDLEAGITGKKGQYKDYYDIVTAIQDGDTEAIDYWYSTHRKQCERMGEFFLGIANGYWENGGDEEAVNEEPQVAANEEPEEEYAGSDGENFDFGDEPMPELNKPKKRTSATNKTNAKSAWYDKYK